MNTRPCVFTQPNCERRNLFVFRFRSDKNAEVNAKEITPCCIKAFACLNARAEIIIKSGCSVASSLNQQENVEIRSSMVDYVWYAVVCFQRLVMLLHLICMSSFDISIQTICYNTVESKCCFLSRLYIKLDSNLIVLYKANRVILCVRAQFDQSNLNFNNNHTHISKLKPEKVEKTIVDYMYSDTILWNLYIF